MLPNRLTPSSPSVKSSRRVWCADLGPERVGDAARHPGTPVTRAVPASDSRSSGALAISGLTSAPARWPAASRRCPCAPSPAGMAITPARRAASGPHHGAVADLHPGSEHDHIRNNSVQQPHDTPSRTAEAFRSKFPSERSRGCRYVGDRGRARRLRHVGAQCRARSCA
jgi:hypothetical protein